MSSFKAMTSYFRGTSNAVLFFNWHGRGGSIVHNGHELDRRIISLAALSGGLAFNITVIPTKCLLIMTLSTLSVVFPSH